ncbi:MAG: Mth938-like domain-containing protein [Pseudolabrys sp.]
MVDTPHLPRPAPIEAYGNGGFRFGGRPESLSHRGSLLCFPDGIWAWPVRRVDELTDTALAAAFARGGALDFSLIGSGRDPWPLPQNLRLRFHELHISVDVMTTGAAVRTWNILLAEGRRVGAGLIAVV